MALCSVCPLQVMRAAFRCVPGNDWHNKNVLTRPLPPVDEMNAAQLLMLLTQAGECQQGCSVVISAGFAPAVPCTYARALPRKLHSWR